VTNRRVIAVQCGSGRQMASCDVDTLLTLVNEGRSSGSRDIALYASSGGSNRAGSSGKWGPVWGGSGACFGSTLTMSIPFTYWFVLCRKRPELPLPEPSSERSSLLVAGAFPVNSSICLHGLLSLE
jgi:hypothetical protein